MCNHNLKQSSKKDVSYCTKCGFLSYKGIPSLTISSLTKIVFIDDPFQLKFKSSQFSIDYSNHFTIYYLLNRNKGINFIKVHSNFFSFPKNVIYKAINYLDLIYLNNNVSIDLIQQISLVCLLLSIEFNSCCTNYSDINLKEFNSYLKNFKNIKEIEILCLKWLDYNLGMLTAYDYIDLFFSLGFIFPSKKENFDISIIYLNCIKLLEIVIEDRKNFDFSSYTIALSIIKMICDYYNCFNNEIFKKIYGVNFNKEKYIKCEQFLHFILNGYSNSLKNLVLNYNYVNLNKSEFSQIENCKNDYIVCDNDC